FEGPPSQRRGSNRWSTGIAHGRCRGDPGFSGGPNPLAGELHQHGPSSRAPLRERTARHREGEGHAEEPPPALAASRPYRDDKGRAGTAPLLRRHGAQVDAAVVAELAPGRARSDASQFKARRYGALRSPARSTLPFYPFRTW